MALLGTDVEENNRAIEGLKNLAQDFHQHLNQAEASLYLTYRLSYADIVEAAISPARRALRIWLSW